MKSEVRENRRCYSEKKIKPSQESTSHYSASKIGQHIRGNQTIIVSYKYQILFKKNYYKIWRKNYRKNGVFFSLLQKFNVNIFNLLQAVNESSSHFKLFEMGSAFQGILNI